MGRSKMASSNDSKLSRKFVHISVGLVFMLFWPLFSSGSQAPYLAAIAPGVNIIRMILFGLGIWRNKVMVKSMSRSEDYGLHIALLDVYTIGREIGKLDGIKVGQVGDLANGRTVRSLTYLLSKYQDVNIYFVAPNVVKMKDDIKDYLTCKGLEWEESTDPMEVASKCDVVYQTRIQGERFGEWIDLYEEARGKYIVDREVMGVLQKHAVIMHPLPRLDEINVDVDGDPRVTYFRQAKNGLYIRMALLKLLLLGW